MKQFSDKSHILVLAPHTDDAEFGMGGSIARFIEEGHTVHCAAFSACRQSVRPEFPEDILITEVQQASALLGVQPSNLHLFEYDVRTFSAHRQSILDDILKLREQIRPDAVFIPSLNDVHQDHKVIAEEGVRAFKQASLFCYELPWNNIVFTNTSYSILNVEQVEKKVKAVSCYRSQQHRPYASAAYIRSLAMTRGVQIGREYAECFEIVRFTF